MKLDFIPLDALFVGKANMRASRRVPGISDILPSVRARGVLTPIIVRPSTQAGPSAGEGEARSAPLFEVLAGSRRFHAAQAVAAERRGAGGVADSEAEKLPCAIIEPGDDAAAIEASLIENIARLDPDEVARWETFARLVREGRTPEDIAATFGLPELAVRRVLALGNLLPRVRRLYREEQIDRASLRHLTLASKAQQREWLGLYDDPQGWAPRGNQLKSWLFGGHSIGARYALFDVEASGLATVADLFGEERYFADAAAFWPLQNGAVAARKQACLDAGWAEAVIVPPGEHFHLWDHARCPKAKGGRVYFDMRENGEVIVHEGYVTMKEARRLEKGEAPGAADKPARPEITGPMQTYLDLHRHAALRAALTSQPGLALRMMAAHAICGSPLWHVRAEPQGARNEAVRESVETCASEAAFDTERRAVLALLEFSGEAPCVTGGNDRAYALVATFLRLAELADEEVLRVIAVVMGETLAAGSAAIEALGCGIGLDMGRCWQADEAFFSLLREREVLTALLAEIGGAEVAEAHASEKAATIKSVIRDHLAGTGGRAKVEGWVPRWMAFPPSSYTERGGVGTCRAHAQVEAVRAERQANAQRGAQAEEKREAGQSGGAGARREAPAGGSGAAAEAKDEAGRLAA